MASETPISLKRKKRIRHPSNSRICVIHYTGLEDYGDVRPFSEYAWNKTQETKLQRQNSDEPRNRLVEICDQIPEKLNFEKHGYHRSCYKNFTNVKYLLSKRKIQGDETDGTEIPLKRKRYSTTGQLFSSELCIICNKQTRYLNRKREKLIKCLTESSKTSICEAALYRSDHWMIGITNNFCLIAKGAHYHPSCRKEYTRKEARHEGKLQDEDSEKQTKDRENAHAQAFQYLKEYVEKHILDEFNVDRMAMLKERYNLYMQEHFPVFYNPNYKTYKLKEKLKKAFGEKIKFWQPNFRSELVYAAESAGGHAVESAFESAASEQRRIEEAGLILRRHILEAYSKKPDIKWPPAAEDLLQSENTLPQLMKTFLTSLLRTKIVNQSERAERLVNSLSQDICYAVTSGKWKLPKQLFLGMTVRHITGSAQVITILNRFGHCVSNSALLELETAMCDRATELDSPLPISICRDNNGVLNLCWDNFDINEETVTGSGTTCNTWHCHSTSGTGK